MGQRFFSAAFASLAFVSTSCGGSQPHSGSTLASSAPPPSSSSSPPAASAAPRNTTRGEVAILPVLEAPWIAGRAGATQHVVSGSMRADLEGENTTFARERFVGAIVSATDVSSGWVFVARDGVVATSASFTGPLVRRGNIGRSIWRVRIGHGRAAVIDEAGGVWTTDGTTDAQHVETLPDGPAIAAVFGDVRHGAVVMDGGHAFATQDGGATWHGVDLGTDAAYNVFLRGAAITLATTAGERGLDDAGRVVPVSHADAPDVDLSRAATRLFLSRARAADTAVIDAVDGERAVLRNGSWWLAEDQNIRVIDANTGAVQRELRGVLPRGACTLHAWGEGFGASCANHDGGLQRSTDGESFHAVAGARPGSEYVFSDDGIHAARRGGCREPDLALDPMSYREAITHVCMYTEGSGWHDIDAGAVIREMRGMHGGSLLVRVFNAEADDPPVRILRAGSESFAPIRLPQAAPDTPDFAIETAMFTTDGWLAAVATQGEGRRATRVLFLGPPERELTMRALPAGALSVGFLDARHGVAAGEDLSKLWRTVDGGDTWLPVNVALEGERRAVPFARESLVPREAIRCAVDRCVVGSVVRIRGLEEPVASDRRVIGPTAQLPSSEEARFGSSSHLSLPRLDCHAPGHARTIDPAGATSDTRRRLSIGAAGVLADFDVQYRDGAASARLRWRGADARGAFDVRATATSWPDDRDASYSIRAGTRAGLLVERCRNSEAPDLCDLFWLTAQGESHSLPSRQALADQFEHRVYVENALALPDGGVLVQLAIRHLGDDAVDEIVHVSPDGTEAAHRSFAWRGSYGTRTLGSFRDASGYVVGEPGDPTALRFYPLTRDPRAEGLALPRLDPQGETHVCGATPGNDAAQILLTGPVVGPSLTSPEGEYVENVRATLEVSRGASCLRSVESWASSFGILHRQVALDGLRLAAGANERLIGTVDAGAGARRWTCE